jgi:hypothetical protein
MRANPGFTATAVASLALGIGVNTAIFSLVDQLLLWSVPARDPDRLVSIQGGRGDMSYPFYRDHRVRPRTPASLSAVIATTARAIRRASAASSSDGSNGSPG